ncbi:hypothetical protein L7F22_014471 [Adiantum nelumboides]|nr:hypothetical protein [Adiantum nelumboides]
MDAYNKKIALQSRGKTHTLDVKRKGESIPTVSASAISSVMKKHFSAYLVFAREVSDCDESNLSMLDKERSMFLQQYSDCFSDSLPSQLPLERLEDHAIDLVPGSSPPNRPPYRVSAAQQKEITSQVEELLEKGLIQHNAEITFDEFLNSLTSPESIDEDKDDFKQEVFPSDSFLIDKDKDMIADSGSEDDYAFFDSLLDDNHEVAVCEDHFEEFRDSLLEDDYNLKPKSSPMIPKIALTPSKEYLEKISSSPNISQMDGYKEEGSSSQDKQSNPTVHETGEGSSQAEEGFPHAAFSITGTASPGILFGGMQSMVPNPMYANIGLHPGFQGTQDAWLTPSFGRRRGCPCYSWGFRGQIYSLAAVRLPRQALEGDTGDQDASSASHSGRADCSDLCHKSPVIKEYEWSAHLARSPGSPTKARKCEKACVRGCAFKFNVTASELASAIPRKPEPSTPPPPAPSQKHADPVSVKASDEPPTTSA